VGHKKRYFIAVTLLDSEDKPTGRMDLLLRPVGPPYGTTFETDDFEHVSNWAKKLRDEYPEQNPIILEQIDP
jgi:hypothetical protein